MELQVPTCKMEMQISIFLEASLCPEVIKGPTESCLIRTKDTPNNLTTQEIPRVLETVCQGQRPNIYFYYTLKQQKHQVQKLKTEKEQNSIKQAPFSSGAPCWLFSDVRGNRRVLQVQPLKPSRGSVGFCFTPAAHPTTKPPATQMLPPAAGALPGDTDSHVSISFLGNLSDPSRRALLCAYYHNRLCCSFLSPPWNGREGADGDHSCFRTPCFVKCC